MRLGLIVDFFVCLIPLTPLLPTSLLFLLSFSLISNATYPSSTIYATRVLV